jgi:hypothetical protein
MRSQQCTASRATDDGVFRYHRLIDSDGMGVLSLHTFRTPHFSHKEHRVSCTQAVGKLLPS